ncbi:hypothetical protein MMC30_007872 [Trapelia coarctata]|nr:hypothetical protein [Trapelia coarctata]
MSHLHGQNLSQNGRSKVEALVYDSIPYVDEPSLEPTANKGLRREIERMSVSYEVQRPAIKLLVDRVKNLESTAEVYLVEISSLKTKTKTLEIAVEKCCDLRERFFEVYKRNLEVDVANRSIIRASNDAAHAGDAVFDATLYSLGRRDDKYIYKQIYFFSPSEIAELDEIEDTLTIGVINQRATLIADTAMVLPSSVEAAFQLFAKALDAHWKKPVNLTDERSKTTQAYWNFRNTYRKEERSGAFKAELS